MKKFLFVLFITLLSINQSFSQIRLGKKKQNEVSVEDIMKRVKESEENRAYKPEPIDPVYTPEQREAIIKQIRNVKKIEDLPIITIIAYYPMIYVTKLITVHNEITDQDEIKWNSEERLNVGDTIRVYGTYHLGEFFDDHAPSIDDLKPVPYKNTLARITPNHDEKSLFIPSRSVQKCLNYRGDRDIWYVYEGRKDTILLREEYLKQKQASE